jgi:hypothetical protein
LPCSRLLAGDGAEDYYDYVFPDDVKPIAGLKILENAMKWKQMLAAANGGAAEEEDEDEDGGGDEEGEEGEGDGEGEMDIDGEMDISDVI